MNEITLQFSEIFVTQLLKLQKYNQNISNTILHLHYLCQSYISPCLLLSTKILFLVRTSTYTLSPYLPITSDHICPRLSGIRPIKRSSANRRSNHEITNFCLSFPSSIPPFPSSARSFRSPSPLFEFLFLENLSSIQGSRRRATEVRVKLRAINNGAERFMLTARNTRDVCSVGTRGLFGFHGRVGSRVKRILFLCHYVITAGGGCGGGREPTGVILAPWERIDAIFTRF